MKIGISVYFIMILHFGIIFQLLYNVIGGHGYPIVPFLIPSIDIESLCGSVSAILLQTLVISFGWTGMAAFDTMIVIIFAHFAMLSDILIERIDELATVRSTAAMREKFYQIIWMQREFNG